MRGGEIVDKVGLELWLIADDPSRLKGYLLGEGSWLCDLIVWRKVIWAVRDWHVGSVVHTRGRLNDNRELVLRAWSLLYKLRLRIRLDGRVLEDRPTLMRRRLIDRPGNKIILNRRLQQSRSTVLHVG